MWRWAHCLGDSHQIFWEEDLILFFPYFSVATRRKISRISWAPCHTPYSLSYWGGVYSLLGDPERGTKPLPWCSWCLLLSKIILFICLHLPFLFSSLDYKLHEGRDLVCLVYHSISGTSIPTHNSSVFSKYLGFSKYFVIEWMNEWMIFEPCVGRVLLAPRRWSDYLLLNYSSLWLLGQISHLSQILMYFFLISCGSSSKATFSVHFSLIIYGKIIYSLLTTCLCLNSYNCLIFHDSRVCCFFVCVPRLTLNSMETEVKIYLSLNLSAPSSACYISMYLAEWDGIWLTALSYHCLHKLTNWFTCFAQQSLHKSRLTPCSRRRSSQHNLPHQFHAFGFRFSYLFGVINFNGQATSPTPFFIPSLMLMAYFKINV